MARDGLTSSRSFEGPALFEDFAEEEQRNGDDQYPDGNGCTERPIKRRAEEALHHVGDHGAGGAADEKGREKVAERKNESKRRAREQARHGKRKNHAPESLNRASAQIL